MSSELRKTLELKLKALEKLSHDNANSEEYTKFIRGAAARPYIYALWWGFHNKDLVNTDEHIHMLIKVVDGITAIQEEA